MKKKGLWITLGIVFGVLLLAGAVFASYRIGWIRGTYATGNEEVKRVIITSEGELEKGIVCDPENAETCLEGKVTYFYPGMMQGMRGYGGWTTYSPRFSRFGHMGLMGFRMFSPLRFLGGLVLLAALVLFIVLIVRLLSRKSRVIIKTQPDVVEVPPVETKEQQ